MNSNNISTKFLLDSGDTNEYKELIKLFKENGHELWGSTTNPTLIAKTLSGRKINEKEAQDLQKQIVLEILSLLPGAVSAEVYSDAETTASEMIEQGEEIARWHKRVVVKLPTTLEGFKARSALRKAHIPVNNTLVFSQEQIFAICLHEKIMQQVYGPIDDLFPPFISPFVGRLEDIGENGMQLVEHGMKIKKELNVSKTAIKPSIWMLEASVRTTQHMLEGFELKTELITAPAKAYRAWLQTPEEPAISQESKFKSIPFWTAPKELTEIETEEEFMDVIQNSKLNIHHSQTDSGLKKFAEDWKAAITS